MSFRSFFANTCETRELHIDPDLRTNYYRNRLNEVTDAVKEIAEEQDINVHSYDKIHKEMHLVGNGFDIIVTFSDVTPIEVGVDFKVNLFVFVGANRPKKKVVMFYKKLKEKLSFKGISLHP